MWLFSHDDAGAFISPLVRFGTRARWRMGILSWYHLNRYRSRY